MYHLDQQDEIPFDKVLIDWLYLTTVKIAGYSNSKIF